MTSRAALAAIDAAVEEWLDKGDCRVRALSPQIVLALIASGFEIRPRPAINRPSTESLLAHARFAPADARRLAARMDTT